MRQAWSTVPELALGDRKVPRAVGCPILPGLAPRVVMERRLAELERLEELQEQGRLMGDGASEELEWLRDYLAKRSRAA